MRVKPKDGKVYAEVTLRDVVERSDLSDLPMLSEIKRLYEENDKLRELVKDMWLTDYAGYFSTSPELQELQAAIWHRICELGIEVNDGN